MSSPKYLVKNKPARRLGRTNRMSFKSLPESKSALAVSFKKGIKQGNMRDADVMAVKEYAAEDADITLQLKPILDQKLLSNPKAITLLKEVEMPLSRVLSSIEREGVTVPVISPSGEHEGIRFAPSQKLDPGVYPEHMVYLKSTGICGQSDLVEVVNGKVNIIDYKTNKEIKTEAFTNWEGITEKMLDPISHLDDCNFNHYALQLSIYMYIILKHNPKLKPGRIFIHHIAFEQEGEDQYGYPVAAKDSDGNPIVKTVLPIVIPYLVDEVISILHYIKDHPVKKK